MNPIIIVGTGLAGYTLAKEFRKINQETPLLMITGDQGVFYSKPLLSTALSYQREIKDLSTSDALTMSEQLNAEILTNTRIVKIDPDKQEIMTQEKTYAYSKLVLALGADVIRIPITGNGAQDMLSVNDLEDYAVFRQSLHGKKRIAIMGAGLVGCEFANDLVRAGHQVDVIALSPYPADRILPEPISLALQQALGEAGVRWHLEQEITQIEKKNDVYHLTLSKGTLEADLVLSAVGLKSRTQLAEKAGLKISRGIIVNQYLQSSNSHIYALGDCAEVNGFVLLFVAPILQCSRALAKTLSNEPTPVKYPAMPISLKTSACPIVVCPPPQIASGQWIVEGKYPNLKAIYVDEQEKMQGFALAGQAVKERLALTQALPALFE